MRKLEPLRAKRRDEFETDPYLKDIVERNLEVAAQACIDIANRVITVEGLDKPSDAYGAIEMLGKMAVLPIDLARRLSPIAGFRNILVHEYLEIDWDQVLNNLQRLVDLHKFAEHVKEWMRNRSV
ncbi:MAG: DUF86 domain-containing protein [Candidatus Bipolaricaulota bacterium]|nr:DUF86 domain-containing protein [Candidatus Bipolaricaulota bacterium]